MSGPLLLPILIMRAIANQTSSYSGVWCLIVNLEICMNPKPPVFGSLELGGNSKKGMKPRCPLLVFSILLSFSDSPTVCSSLCVQECSPLSMGDAVFTYT